MRLPYTLERFAVEVRKVADELERTASVVNALDSDLLGELQLGESGGAW